MNSGLKRLSILLIAGILAWPAAAAAELDFGGGMEYFTVRTDARNAAGQRLDTTIIQSTLGVAKLAYLNPPWVIELSGGMTDWNVSGEWRGVNGDTYNVEPFGWSWQQFYQVEADYFFLSGLGLGARFQNHAFRHYTGDTQFTFLEYRKQTADLLLTYQFFRRPDLVLSLSGAYAPWVKIEIYQNTYIPTDLDTVSLYNSSSLGHEWSGELKMSYRQNQQGWGLDFSYQAGRPGFSQPENLSDFSMFFGRLSGFFWVRFW
jgi:hypothetical protein